MATIYNRGQKSGKVEKGSKDSAPIELWVGDAEKKVPIDLTGRGLVFKLSDGSPVYLFTEDLEDFLLKKREEQVSERESMYQYVIQSDGPSLFDEIFP